MRNDTIMRPNKNAKNLLFRLDLGYRFYYEQNIMTIKYNNISTRFSKLIFRKTLKFAKQTVLNFCW